MKVRIPGTPGSLYILYSYFDPSNHWPYFWILWLSLQRIVTETLFYLRLHRILQYKHFQHFDKSLDIWTTLLNYRAEHACGSITDSNNLAAVIVVGGYDNKGENNLLQLNTWTLTPINGLVGPTSHFDYLHHKLSLTLPGEFYWSEG
jgi:hypothetical protein